MNMAKLFLFWNSLISWVSTSQLVESMDFNFRKPLPWQEISNSGPMTWIVNVCAYAKLSMSLYGEDLKSIYNVSKKFETRSSKKSIYLSIPLLFICIVSLIGLIIRRRFKSGPTEDLSISSGLQPSCQGSQNSNAYESTEI